MPIKTTIDANAPILMQWIVSSPERLNKEAEAGRHPLPNTETFPHRQRLVNMAKMEPDRLICLYYLGDTLNDGQNQQMQDLEKLAPNIRAIDFNKLNWSEYDFEFNTDHLTIDLGKKKRIIEYLKSPNNVDNCLAFRIDMMRILMLLKCPKAALLELNKVGIWNKPIGEGGIYFDFDAQIEGKIGELKAPLGILAARTEPFFKCHYRYENGAIAVSNANHPVIVDTYKEIKADLEANLIYTGVALYKKLRSIITSHLDIQNEFDESSQKKVFNSIQDLEKNMDQYPDKSSQEIISNLKSKLEKANNSKEFLDVIELDVMKKADNASGSHLEQMVYFSFIRNFENFALQDIDRKPTKNTNSAREAELDRILKEKMCLNTAINKNDAKFGIPKSGLNWDYKHHMYKDTELEIKNSISTNLKNVEQEQDKGCCILQ